MCAHAQRNFLHGCGQVRDAYTLKGGLKHIGAQISKALPTDLGVFQKQATTARARCRIEHESLLPATPPAAASARGVAGALHTSSSGFEADVVCDKGFGAHPADILLFKMSFHPLWQAWACDDGGGGEDLGGGACRGLELLHTAPNLMGVSLMQALGGAAEGKKVRVVFRFRTPRDQYVLFLVGCGLLVWIMSVWVASSAGRRRGLWRNGAKGVGVGGDVRVDGGGRCAGAVGRDAKAD